MRKQKHKQFLQQLHLVFNWMAVRQNVRFQKTPLAECSASMGHMDPIKFGGFGHFHSTALNLSCTFIACRQAVRFCDARALFPPVFLAVGVW